ncbi:hypothetical protein K1T71_000052 [Dendrolimus kikuchii]|uniref:Uncharacterized protein n=1 Tax=Dendrolimus kikuchii TaxID=765133 RepID=A0ACC1DI41_9NEOP|nr:hypothetical protein K1T71_000052 [Dendrolimus kikuchii]
MADAKIRNLIKKRTSIKGKLTFFINFLDSLKPSSSLHLSELQLTELEYRMNRIDSISVDYDALQTEIESLSDNPDEQLTERGHFESQFYSAMSLARTMLAPGHAQLRAGSVAHSCLLQQFGQFTRSVCVYPSMYNDTFTECVRQIIRPSSSDTGRRDTAKNC